MNDNSYVLRYLDRYVRLDRTHNLLVIGCEDEAGMIGLLRREHNCCVYGMENDIALFEKAQKGTSVNCVIRGRPGSGVFVATGAFSVIVAHDEESAEETRQIVRWAHSHLVEKGVLALTVRRANLKTVLRHALAGFDPFHSFGMPSTGRAGLILTQREKTRRPDERQIELLAKVTDQRMAWAPLPDGKTKYPTPPPPRREDVEPFRSFWRSPEEIEEALRRSSLKRDAIASVTRIQTVTGEIPPLPPKTGHVALQLATGRFDGAVGRGEYRHVVKGRVTRTPVTTEEETETGDTVTATRQTLSIEIATVNRDGKITVLSSKEADCADA